MRTNVPIVFVAVALSLGGVGCTQPTAPTISDGDVFSNPAALAGQTVQVEGLFQGYRAGECRFAAAARPVGLTRSDWLVRRETMCLYVTGGFPPGLDPLDPAAIGQQVKLRARVIDDGDGKFLLQIK